MLHAISFFSFLGSFACSESKVIGVVDETTSSSTDTAAPDTTDTDTDTDTADDSMWDGASLVVEQPLSGDFLPFEEDASFVAAIYSADGQRMDFEDIRWSSNLDSDWSLLGSDVTDDSLDAGEHTITVEATLPNGDRLQSAQGIVFVQHEDAGIYVGDVRVDVTLTWDKTDYTAGCVGAVTLVVDAYGESAIGESACVVSLFGYEQELAYSFDMNVDEGDVDGEAAVDLFIYALEFDVEGDIGGGEISTSWEDTDTIDISGDLNASRITRYLGE